MDVMQVPGAADARQVSWVDGRHILKPDSALVRAALDLLATHVADAAAGTSPRCGQCGRYFPCPTVENARQVVVAGGGLLTVAGKRERKGSAAAVRTEVGGPAARETPVADVTRKARAEAVPEKAAAEQAAPERAAQAEPAQAETVEAPPVGVTPVAAAPVDAAPVDPVPAEAAAEKAVEAATDGPAGPLAAGMKVTVTQIPAALVPGLPAQRVPDTAAGHTKEVVPAAGEQVTAPIR